MTSTTVYPHLLKPTSIKDGTVELTIGTRTERYKIFSLLLDGKHIAPSEINPDNYSKINRISFYFTTGHTYAQVYSFVITPPSETSV
jgi:hypothetical protein